jgi:hypothetical protein
MQAEIQFLSYAVEVAPKYVPKLLHEDRQNRTLVLEYLTGDTYKDNQAVNVRDIKAAIDFFRKLNIDQNFAKQKVNTDAAEGFLSITEHIKNVSDRINCFTTIHVPKEVESQASIILRLLKRELCHTVDKVSNLVSSGQIKDALDPEARYLSPGDFGFHNAIRGRYGVKFFDFEFAGWDDPSKTLIDFLLQPRVSISGDLAYTFVDDFCKLTDVVISQREAALASILRLKWLCIILAPLDKKRLKAIAETNQVSSEGLIKTRILRAVEYIKRTNLTFFDSFLFRRRITIS